MGCTGVGVKDSYAKAVIAVETLWCAGPDISFMTFKDTVDLVVRQSVVVGQSEEVWHLVLRAGREAADQQ